MPKPRTTAAPVDHRNRAPIAISPSREDRLNAARTEGEGCVLDMETHWKACCVALEESDSREGIEAVRTLMLAYMDLQVARLSAWFYGMLLPALRGQPMLLSEMPSHIAQVRAMEAVTARATDPDRDDRAGNGAAALVSAAGQMLQTAEA